MGEELKMPNGWPQRCEFIADFPSDRENGFSDELQGVTHDDTHWYFAQKLRLLRIPVGHDLSTHLSEAPAGIVLVSPSVPGLLPPHLEDFTHLGDLDFSDGKLYVAAEPETTAQVPRIVVFDAETLTCIADAPLVGQISAPWCAVHPISGVLYSSEFDGVEELKRYRIDWTDDFSLERLAPCKLPAGTRLDHVQGGTFSPEGRLFLSCSTAEGGIYGVDADQGTIHLHSKVDFQPRKLGFNTEELEGLTYWDLDGIGAPSVSGVLHLVMIDNFGSGDDDLYFKHFRFVG
jgi:hypothetical protein